MKKIVIFIVLAASMNGMLLAQDTVWQKLAPLSNYYFNNWLDTSEGCSFVFPNNSNAFVYAKQFIATPEDSLQVYGIAAIMMNDDEFSYVNYPSSFYPTFQSMLDSLYPQDPSLEHCEESLMLYQYHGGTSTVMQQVGDPLPIHYLYTPVTHWMMSNTPPVSFADTIAKPVYERYFTEPQTVTDTFYTGYTAGHFKLKKVVNAFGDTTFIGTPVRPRLTGIYVTPSSFDTGYDEGEAFLIPSSDSTKTWTFRNNNSFYTMYIFPILNPKPDPEPDTTFNPIDTTDNPIDTTVGPDSTLTGIGKVDMVGRYVSVSPNPAGDRATVVSSFGLTAIEAYDPQGRQLYTAPATGLKAGLDVSAWPRGTVLLHIHTPAGTAVKKLLLR